MVPRHIVEAHAAAEIGESARRTRHYNSAVAFGARAWRLVERDESRPGVEAFLKGTHAESWGLQMTGELELARLSSVQGYQHARRFAAGTLLEAWTLLRVLEVQSALAEEWLRPTRLAAWQLAARLSGQDDAAELRFVAWYTTLNVATKLGETRAAEIAEMNAESALQRMSDPRFEHVLRTQQALFATWNGRFDDAHRFIEASHAAHDSQGRAIGPQFPLAHLFLASGETEEGKDVLQRAVDDAAAVGNWQAIRGGLNYMAPWVEPGAIHIPSSDEVPARVSPASLN